TGCARGPAGSAGGSPSSCWTGSARPACSSRSPREERTRNEREAAQGRIGEGGAAGACGAGHDQRRTGCGISFGAVRPEAGSGDRAGPDADDGAGGPRAGARLGDPARSAGGRAGGRVRRRPPLRRGRGGGDRRAVRRAHHAHHGAAGRGDGRVVMLGGIGSALMVLGVSLALFGAVLWLVKRLTGAPIGGRGTFPLEVLGRVAVGPRQGVTALRVGRRVVLVSVGEGGVRPLLDLPGEEWTAAVEEAHGVASGPAREFRARLLRSLRVSASIAGAVLIASGAAPAEAAASEWAAAAGVAMLQVAPGAPAAPPQAAAPAQQGARVLPPG